MQILISNSYGTPNLGDEAILHAMCDYYSQHGHQVRILTNTDNKPARKLPQGVTYALAGPWHTLNSVKHIKKADLLLIGGGGIIQSSTSLANLLFHLSRTWIAMLLGTPFAITGIGAGPIPHKLGRILTRWAINNAKSISVRDHESADYLRALGINREIPIYTDLAFGLPKIKVSRKKTEATLRIGISLRPDVGPRKARLNYNNALELGLKIVEGILSTEKNLGRKIHITFISFNDEQDLEIGRNIAQIHNASARIDLCPASTTPLDRIKFLANLDLTIAMRLHCIILSALASTPSIGIPYDPKVKVALEALQQNDLVLEDGSSPLQIQTLLTRIIPDLENRREAIQRQAEHARFAAKACMRLAIE